MGLEECSGSRDARRFPWYEGGGVRDGGGGVGGGEGGKYPGEDCVVEGGA